RYFTGTPLWGFGHGLSYTRFAYDPVQAATGIAAGDTLNVTATVRNTGARDGEEVVQAYLVPPAPAGAPSLTEAVLQRQLVGYSRVAVKRGGS
ncbi:hypothetical protein SJ407_26255, partial [Serratia marcescens]|nr:hypothetical protein [Serratia marcescens]